jgi:hypothetical protein
MPSYLTAVHFLGGASSQSWLQTFAVVPSPNTTFVRAGTNYRVTTLAWAVPPGRSDATTFGRPVTVAADLYVVNADTTPVTPPAAITAV